MRSSSILNAREQRLQPVAHGFVDGRRLHAQGAFPRGLGSVFAPAQNDIHFTAASARRALRLTLVQIYRDSHQPLSPVGGHAQYRRVSLPSSLTGSLSSRSHFQRQNARAHRVPQTCCSTHVWLNQALHQAQRRSFNDGGIRCMRGNARHLHVKPGRICSPVQKRPERRRAGVGALTDMEASAGVRVPEDVQPLFRRLNLLAVDPFGHVSNPRNRSATRRQHSRTSPALCSAMCCACSMLPERPDMFAINHNTASPTQIALALPSETKTRPATLAGKTTGHSIGAGSGGSSDRGRASCACDSS